MRVDGEGVIYDCYGPDYYITPEDYTEKFLSNWDHREDEFYKYLKKMKLKILRINQSTNTCEQ